MESRSIGNCWINHFVSFVLLFLVPLVLSLAINFSMFVIVTGLLYLSSRNKSKMQQSKHVILIRVWLAVFIVTGLTWLFGFLAIPDQTSWAWYPFIVFNSTQGFSICLAFLFTKKTLKLYIGLFTGKRKISLLTSSKQSKASLRTQTSSAGNSTSELRGVTGKKYTYEVRSASESNL